MAVLKFHNDSRLHVTRARYTTASRHTARAVSTVPTLCRRPLNEPYQLVPLDGSVLLHYLATAHVDCTLLPAASWHSAE